MNVIELIKHALNEDILSGDVTSELVVDKNKVIGAIILAKEKGILAGINVARDVFRLYDKSIFFEAQKNDGSSFNKGDVVARVNGNARSILSCERTALNFLQHLSGIATTAQLFRKRVRNSKAQVLDTRKTLPGLRKLEKYAARIGGIKNHRMGLYDMILVKDNHIKASGGFSKILRILKNIKTKSKIEIEIGNLRQLELLLRSKASVDIVMLDNFLISDIRKGLKLIKGHDKKIQTEYSGNVTLENISGIAATGVDFISVGSSLTLSSKAIDFSMKIL